MEHFAIVPETEMYVLRRSILKFRLVLMKRTDSSTYSEKGFWIYLMLIFKKNSDIHLPNPNYHWDVDKAELGEIQQTGILRVKNELGTIKVIVKDTSKIYLKNFK